MNSAARRWKHRERGLGDRSIVVFDSPRDVKGTALLSHTKILDPDDQWLYLPALERVKRISSGEQVGSVRGERVRVRGSALAGGGKVHLQVAARRARTTSWSASWSSAFLCTRTRATRARWSGGTRSSIVSSESTFTIARTSCSRHSLISTTSSTLEQYWRSDRFRDGQPSERQEHRPLLRRVGVPRRPERERLRAGPSQASALAPMHPVPPGAPQRLVSSSSGAPGPRRSWPRHCSSLPARQGRASGTSPVGVGAEIRIFPRGSRVPPIRRIRGCPRHSWPSRRSSTSGLTMPTASHRGTVSASWTRTTTTGPTLDLRELHYLHLSGTAGVIMAGSRQGLLGASPSPVIWVDIINQNPTARRGHRPGGQTGSANGESHAGAILGARSIFSGLPLFRERTFPDDDARLRGTAADQR